MSTPATLPPFRFGVQATAVTGAREFLEKVRWAESVGFNTFTLPDHLGPYPSPLVALAYAAAATERIRVGTFVLNNDLRHPVVLAKELATLDVLSGGRVEVGIGAGWMRHEYVAAGLDFDLPERRISRLTESITVLERMWADEPASFAGQYYTITKLDGQPKPIQRPHPPILIGGGGRRLLTLAARRADIVAINPQARLDGTLDWPATSAPGWLADRVDWIRTAAGSRVVSIELNMNIRVEIGSNAGAAADRIANAWSVDRRTVMTSSFALVGNRAAVVTQLHERREQFGTSYITVGERGMRSLAPAVEELAGT